MERPYTSATWTQKDGRGAVTELTSRDVFTGQNGFFAELVERTDGLPIRPIVDGRRARTVGMYFSVKNGAAAPWEAGTELFGFHLAELTDAVVSYRAQPHTLRMRMVGRAATYTPDREDILSDGTRRIIEIKGRDKGDADYQAKLSAAGRAYAALGWTFECLDLADYRASARFPVVDLIQSRRRTTITIADVHAVQSVFESEALCGFGQVTRALGAGQIAVAKFSAMVARRYLAIDESFTLTDDAPVALGGALK